MGPTQLGKQDRNIWMAEQLYHHGHNVWIHSWLYASCSCKENQSELKRAEYVRHLVLFFDERFDKIFKDVRMPWTQILKNVSGRLSHMRKRINCFFSGKKSCSTCFLKGMPFLRLNMRKALQIWHFWHWKLGQVSKQLRKNDELFNYSTLFNYSSDSRFWRVSSKSHRTGQQQSNKQKRGFRSSAVKHSGTSKALYFKPFSALMCRRRLFLFVSKTAFT